MKLSRQRVVRSWNSPDLSGLGELCFVSNPASPGRRFAPHQSSPLAVEAFAAFGLVIDKPEPMFGNLVGNHFQNGAAVHPHKDSAPQGFAHVRCNWMLKKPERGGNPVLDGEEFDVSEGDLWLCIASQERHWSTPVFGGERLIYSFGALVSDDQITRVLCAKECSCE
jgi:hypothetical protein